MLRGLGAEINFCMCWHDVVFTSTVDCSACPVADSCRFQEVLRTRLLCPDTRDRNMHFPLQVTSVVLPMLSVIPAVSIHQAWPPTVETFDAEGHCYFAVHESSGGSNQWLHCSCLTSLLVAILERVCTCNMSGSFTTLARYSPRRSGFYLQHVGSRRSCLHWRWAWPSGLLRHPQKPEALCLGCRAECHPVPCCHRILPGLRWRRRERNYVRLLREVRGAPSVE